MYLHWRVFCGQENSSILPKSNPDTISSVLYCVQSLFSTPPDHWSMLRTHQSVPLGSLAQPGTTFSFPQLLDKNVVTDNSHQLNKFTAQLLPTAKSSPLKNLLLSSSLPNMANALVFVRQRWTLYSF